MRSRENLQTGGVENYTDDQPIGLLRKSLIYGVILEHYGPLTYSRMKMTPANPAVGNWRNNGPEMLEPPC